MCLGQGLSKIILIYQVVYLIIDDVVIDIVMIWLSNSVVLIN